MDENPWFDDTFYLKFCRARKFDFEKVVLMWTNYMTYRGANGINTILQDFVYEKRPEVFAAYPSGYAGIDKTGRPIYIERNGQLQVAKVWEAVEEDYLLRAFMHSYENQAKLQMFACSHLAGH